MNKLVTSLVLATLTGPFLSGCATTSFAPPSVNLENEMAVRGSNFSFGQRCMPNERLGSDGKVIPIPRSASGARALINNYVYTYRCRAHSAANGRQAFEVPSLLTGLGTATAMAFGAPSDVAIAGGAATAGLNASKNYYDPKLKAAIYDSALDALLCIKNEAVGVDPVALGKISSIEKSAGIRQQDLLGEGVVVTKEEQYYELVTTSLFSVERVLAQRLSNVGTFDPAGVIAEIKTLAEEVEKETEEAKQTVQGETEALITDGVSLGVLPTMKVTETANEKARVAQTIVKIDTLGPKLQQCVVRAKI